MTSLSISYIDQPRPFWRDVSARFGSALHEIYFPLPREVFGSGRPELPSAHMRDFLESDDLPKSVLLNPVALDDSYEQSVDRLFPYLEKLLGRYRIDGATVRDERLLGDLRRAFPSLLLCASTLMEIEKPAALAAIAGKADVMVPASWAVRDLATLSALRRAWPGRLKLLVNEGCLVRCQWRFEHFQQMNDAPAGARRDPPTLCFDALRQQPWLRLTGGWILPQHLDMLDGLFDIIKIAGRGTLQTPEEWLEVAEAYLHRTELPAHRIGVGPAGVSESWNISREFYRTTLLCDKNCQSCSICSDYHDALTHVRQ